MLNVLIEGWIKHPHSYTVVNVYQIIALSKNPRVHLILKEEPAFKETWPVYDNLVGLFLTEDEQKTLDSVERFSPDKNMNLDLVYRITYPYNVAELEYDKLPVSLFYTAEFQLLQDSHFSNGTLKTCLDRCFNKQIYPVTPSKWSAVAFQKHKYGPVVIPHGVDMSKYYPFDDEERKVAKSKFREDCGIAPDAFIFLTVGAMTGNKNVVGMIKAWYRLTYLVPNITLVLKGIGDLYSCGKNINDVVKELKRVGIIDREHWKTVRSQLVYIDTFYGYKDLCNLYNSCDCYLSPYIAEGFNIPVLEAAACGLPLIVSKGGATDDFTLDTFAKYPITLQYTNTTKNSNGNGEEKKEQCLIVDDTSLQETMMSVVSDTEFCENARLTGPLHVLKNFTWNIVADRLVAYWNVMISDFDLSRIPLTLQGSH